jgi:hypothetical protein
MSPIFDFNVETALLLSVEQKQLFLSPFVPTKEEYDVTLSENFGRVYRRAGKLAVRDMTILVVKQMPEELQKFPAIIAMPDDQDPSTWGFAFRYRADVPWYVVCLAGCYQEPCFGSYPIVQLLYSKDLISWPPLDRFISDGLWGIQQNKTPNWNPLDNFLYTISPYIRPNLIHDLQISLRNVNFFPVETEGELEFKLEQDKSENAWEEIRAMARSFFYPMVDPGLQEFWQKVKDHPRTQVWVARSLLYPEPDPGEKEDRVSGKLRKKPEPTILGFIVGGLHPISEEPQIHGVCVLPDERRRGIATSLIKRFFSQTGYASAVAGVYMGPHAFQYEGAALLKKLGGTVKTKGRFVWHWELPSPLRVNVACSDR